MYEGLFELHHPHFLVVFGKKNKQISVVPVNAEYLGPAIQAIGLYSSLEETSLTKIILRS